MRAELQVHLGQDAQTEEDKMLSLIHPGAGEGAGNYKRDLFNILSKENS